MLPPQPLEVGDRVLNYAQTEFARVLAVDGRRIQVNFGGKVQWMDKQKVVYAPNEAELYARARSFRGVVTGHANKPASGIKRKLALHLAAQDSG